MRFVMAEEDGWSSVVSLEEVEDMIREAEALPKLSPLLRRRILKEAVSARSRRTARRTGYAAASILCVAIVGLAILTGYVNSSLQLDDWKEMDPGVAAHDPDLTGPRSSETNISTPLPGSGEDSRYMDAAFDSPLRRLQHLRRRSGE
jgi:hypothetical protein